jgi:hypothetical protein
MSFMASSRTLDETISLTRGGWGVVDLLFVHFLKAVDFLVFAAFFAFGILLRCLLTNTCV